MRPPLSPPEAQTWTFSDGYTAYGRCWPPRDGVRTAVLYLHGIQSHGGWYEWSASLLANCGAGVILPDRRGSGRNIDARGDVERCDRWLADLDEIADWAAKQWGVRRFGVAAVSWGGKLAVRWSLKRFRQVDALLLVAPGLFPAVDVSAWTRARIAWALAFRPTRLFSIPLNDAALFTDDPAGRVFIETDPAKLMRGTARLLFASAVLDRQLLNVWDGALPFPTTLVLAERDRIIRNAPTESWLRRISARPPEIHTLPAAHLIEFEPDIQAYEQLLRDWARSLYPAAELQRP